MVLQLYLLAPQVVPRAGKEILLLELVVMRCFEALLCPAAACSHGSMAETQWLMNQISWGKALLAGNLVPLPPTCGPKSPWGPWWWSGEAPL